MKLYTPIDQCHWRPCHNCNIKHKKIILYWWLFLFSDKDIKWPSTVRFWYTLRCEVECVSFDAMAWDVNDQKSWQCNCIINILYNYTLYFWPIQFYYYFIHNGPAHQLDFILLLHKTDNKFRWKWMICNPCVTESLFAMQ